MSNKCIDIVSIFVPTNQRTKQDFLKEFSLFSDFETYVESLQMNELGWSLKGFRSLCIFVCLSYTLIGSCYVDLL